MLSPGQSPGELFVDGNLYLDSGTLVLETNELGVFDLLNVTGLINVGQGFDISLSYSSSPFDYVAIESFFSGSKPSFEPGFSDANISVFSMSMDDVGRIITVGYGDQAADIMVQLGIPPVPEPSTWLTFGFGLMFVVRSISMRVARVSRSEFA